MGRRIVCTDICRQAENLPVDIAEVLTCFDIIICFLVEVGDLGVKRKFIVIGKETAGPEIKIVPKKCIIVNNPSPPCIVIGEIGLNSVTATAHRNSVGKRAAGTVKIIVIVGMGN